MDERRTEDVSPFRYAAADDRADRSFLFTAAAGQRCCVFDGNRMVAAGSVDWVTRSVAKLYPPGSGVRLIAFDEASGLPVPLARRDPGSRSPGRPRLGVEARAVMLLPRHWQWLSEQPGGASAYIRGLVEQAWLQSLLENPWPHAARHLQQFAEALLEEPPGLAAACAALASGNLARAAVLLEPWPTDVRHFARKVTRWSLLEARHQKIFMNAAPTGREFS